MVRGDNDDDVVGYGENVVGDGVSSNNVDK